MKDYFGKEMLRRQRLMKTFIDVFERYGFNSLQTPVVEQMNVLSAKYAAGETSDIMKEVFRVSDQGGRDLGLRFDLTVPLARFVAENLDLKLPFKRYEIGRVYRDGPIKAGRTREFWQCDADIVGSSSISADAEALNVVLDVFSQLGLDVTIKVNNRKFLNAVIAKAGITDVEATITSIDKLDKIGRDGVMKELSEKGIDGTELLAILDKQGSNELLDQYKDFDGVDELQQLFNLVPGITFVPTLARGLAYYTGMIFEVFSDRLSSSLAAGGRYDKLIGQYGGRDVPAVGLSFGIESILAVLGESDEESTTQLFIIPIGIDAGDIARQCRERGINTDIDIMGRGISANIRYADSYGIPYVLFVGENELKEGKFTLKELKTGEEKKITMDALDGNFI